MKLICVDNMKVICVNNNVYSIDNKFFASKSDITIGKEYDVEMIVSGETFQSVGMCGERCAWSFTSYYIIIDDNGNRNRCPSECFLTIKEYRNQRLKEIGI